MSRFLSSRFSGLKAYVPGEQPKDTAYIKLNTNESPYPPAPQVIEAISRGEIEKLRLYGDPECTELRKTLAEYCSVTPEHLMMGNGSDEILSFVFMAYCDKNTGVSYPDISYGFYSVYADLYGISSEEIPLKENFAIDPEDYRNRGRTIVLANPNAPTGLCLTVEDIEKIVASNPDNVVIIDEAYIDFGGQSCIPLVRKYDNLLVVQTYSKSRSLAGARLGYAVGNPALIHDLNRLRFSVNPYNVSRLTMLAGKAAIEAQPYYDNKNAEIILTREYASAKLKELGFLLTDSRANFILAKYPGMGGSALYEGLKARGILVRHFNKPRISDFVRITIGTKEQMDAMILSLEEMLGI
ncbi:MAG: histidinol-phosphate transaminase [Clostridiales bacterium]|nr:histidinol-phosphate transaminase [Clostridiales bacterium]